MDPIKEAFSKAKQDISELKYQFSQIIYDINEIKDVLNILLNNQESIPTDKQTDNNENSTYSHQIQTEDTLVSPNPTDNIPLQAPITPNNTFSIGNGGVPTDRQTDKQTNRQTHISNKIEQIDQVSRLLDSLDTIKKDIRSRFKHLTKQEMLVFSTIYQLEEEGFIVDYPLIAKKLALSESSIRDYSQRIIKKGIPIQKDKENNKKITLSISKDFKKIASLQTIIALREI